jgi:plastocyanin
VIRWAPLCATASLLALSAAQADDSNTIIQNGRAFHPGEITINAGQTLTFSNRDAFIHQIYVVGTPPLYDSDEQPPGQDIQVTFPTSGTFEVHCHIHPKMLLIVHVK